MRYLYDTNIISNLIRSPEEKVGQRTAELAIGDLGTSIIVAAELRFGYRNRGSRRLEMLAAAFSQSGRQCRSTPRVRGTTNTIRLIS